jgi:glyoxylase-like metal-dependent hydrolase (beta-lactamase superfamily II)
MKIDCFQLGPFLVNCYLVTADAGAAGPETILIDAPDEVQQVIAHCDRLGLKPRLLLNTHGHVDHISGNAAVKEHWPALKLAIHAADAAKLGSPLRNLSLLLGQVVTSPPADVLLTDGQKLTLGDEVLEVRHTPGHTPGGISLILREPRPGPSGGDVTTPVAFTGDTLFAGSVGRTDFPGASSKALLSSIRRQLFTLADETLCYPGHGPPTTIGEERAHNPYVGEK